MAKTYCRTGWPVPLAKPACCKGHRPVQEVEETFEQPLGLLEFRGFSSFDGWKLVEIVNGVEGVVVNGIISWVGTSSLNWR
ncbi:hypothetical protein Tco_1228353 [Tanacetum coccineum]